MIGDPAKIEHDPPMAKPAQFVLADPGPTVKRSKAKPGLDAKVIKFETGGGFKGVRSTMNPVLPTAGVPAALVNVVPPPTTKDPFVPPTGGLQSTKLIPTVTTPAPESIRRRPSGIADASAEKIASAPRTTNKATSCCLRFRHVMFDLRSCVKLSQKCVQSMHHKTL
jgi:hypothetical protein